jgi:hypothetical protein
VAALGEEEEEDDEEGVDEDHAGGEMNPLKHTLLTAAIVVSGFTIAFFVNDLQMVGAPSISIVLPSYRVY